MHHAECDTPKCECVSNGMKSVTPCRAAASNQPYGKLRTKRAQLQGKIRRWYREELITLAGELMQITNLDRTKARKRKVEVNEIVKNVMEI